MSRPLRRDSDRPRTAVAAGAVAGTAATMAMVLAAAWLYRRLPPPQRYPLPPRELTERILERTAIGRRMDEDARAATGLAAHFCFGTVAGAAYGLLRRRSQRRPVATGAVYGLALWASGYFGWVPALGLLRNAASHPLRRNALMAATHLLWGGLLGLFQRRLLDAASGPLGRGPVRDA